MVEIYRDARDFQNILGAYGLGKGYGYDALAGGWGSSTGHGSSYAAATHLAAADPTDARQGTRFDDVYTNSIGEAPAGRISGFPADNYYVWLLVGGGSNAERGAHGVSIGANPEEIVNSPADSRIFAWQQVGANAYAIDAATPIDIQWKNIDGYLHAIRAICLKSDVGAPGQMPAGNGGDLIVGPVLSPVEGMAAAPPVDSTTAPPTDSGGATATTTDSTTTAPADTTTTSADSTTPPPVDSTTTTTESAATPDSTTPAADTTTSAESTPPVDSGQSAPDTSAASTDSSGSGAADSGSEPTDSTSTAPADSGSEPTDSTSTAPADSGSEPTDSTSTAPADSSSGSTDAGGPAPADSGSTTTTDTGAVPADSTASAPTDSTTSAPADSSATTGDAAPADSTTAPMDSGSAPPADTPTQPADTGNTPEVPPPPVEAPPPSPAAPKPPKRPPRPSMSESELVNRMAAAPVGAELTKVGIKALVNTLFEEVTKALAAGEEFTFGGFGRFHVTGTKEHVGRDPRSGVQLLVPAKKVVKFKPHTFLRDTVMPPAPKMEIYRDLRDFQGIPGSGPGQALGAHAPGNGYGYDASLGGWDGSLAHGSEYDAARMLSATGPSANKINVRFGDDYVNSLGAAPVNRAAFQRGNYYVWLLVLGGSGIPAGAHSVKMGDNSEVVVSSGNQPDSPIWQQAGNGLYMIQGGTPIEVGFLAPDGAIHAVVAICLKNSQGVPGQMPAGNGGDMLVTLQ